MYNKKEQQKAIEDLNRLAALYDMSVMHTFEPLEKAIIELISYSDFEGEDIVEKHFNLSWCIDSYEILNLEFYYGKEDSKTIDLYTVRNQVERSIYEAQTEHAEIRADEQNDLY